MELERREYLRDVRGSVDFDLVDTFAIDPVRFPWAKEQARLYNSYSFEYAIFEYVPAVGSQEGGSVLLAPVYDPTDQLTASEGKAAFLNLVDAAAGPAWCPLAIRCQKEDIMQQKRLFAQATTQSQSRFTSGGNVFFCASGNTDSTSIIGEIWVTYLIRFKSPQLPDPKGGRAIGAGGAKYSGTSNAAPFGTLVSSETIPVTGPVADGTTSHTSTWTFTDGWSGYLSYNVTGTGNINGNATQGTATVSQQYINDNDSDVIFSECYFVNADQGDTLVITLTNTTITAAVAIFTQCPDLDD